MDESEFLKATEEMFKSQCRDLLQKYSKPAIMGEQAIVALEECNNIKIDRKGFEAPYYFDMDKYEITGEYR